MLDCVLYVRRARAILFWYDFERQRKVSRVLGQQLLFKYGKYNRVVGSLHIYDCHTSQITSGQCITKCSVLLHMRVSNDLCKHPYMKCSICSSVRGRRPLCWRVGVGLFLYMKPAIERENCELDGHLMVRMFGDHMLEAVLGARCLCCDCGVGACYGYGCGVRCWV